MTDERDDLLIDAFIQVFRGRGDVYGNAKGYCENVALTRPVFERHLRSTNPADHIGVYCMVGTNASWGCIDIDGKDWPLYGPESPAPLGLEPHQLHDWDAMLTLAINLATVMSNAPGGPIHPHIERTKNGYHIWVFPEQPLVPAAAMRRALMAACVAIGYDPKEVNPKAEGPRPGTKGYGNFVRLSHGGSLATNQATATAGGRTRQELDSRESGVAGGPAGRGGMLRHQRVQEGGQDAQVLYRPADDGRGYRPTGAGSGWCGRCGHSWGPIEVRMERHLVLQGPGADGGGSAGAGSPALDGGTPTPSDPSWPQRVFLDDQSGLPLCLTCTLLSVKRTPLARLEAAAALWTPPAGASDRQVDFNAGLEVEPLLPLLDGKSYTIWKDGPLPGSDRSTTLARLAHLLAERGLTATQAFAVTKSADERWGKFHLRGDCDEQLARFIERAYE